MGDESRTGKLHYGMGLYIANNIVEKYGGTLTLCNSGTLGGACVVVKLG